MTGEERRALERFILGREWVPLTIGALLVGISLVLALGSRLAERGAGVALLLLSLLAVGLYIWSRTRRDLLAGQVAEGEAAITAKAVEQHPLTTFYYLLDADANRYEVSSQDYERAQVGETYRLLYSLGTHIVLSLTRVRKL